MVNIVVLSASPERKEVVQAPGELIATVRIDGLEQTEDDPAVHGQDVEILGDGAPDDGASYGTETEDHDFDRRGVLSSQTEGRRVLVVNLVDVLVKERAGVHETVSPVVPRVLHHEEDGDLVGHLVEGRKRDVGFETEVLAHGVEQPDLGKLDGEVGQKDERCTLQLLPGGGNLVLFNVSIAEASKAWELLTAWILYFLNMGSISIMIHGSDRPK